MVMRMSAFTSVVAMIAVSDVNSVLPWYEALLGSPADIPMEGVAEWRIADNAWLQVSVDEDRAGGSSVILQTHDVERARREAMDNGFTVGEIADYGVVRVVDLDDPVGNRVSLVQEV